LFIFNIKQDKVVKLCLESNFSLLRSIEQSGENENFILAHSRLSHSKNVWI